MSNSLCCLFGRTQRLQRGNEERDESRPKIEKVIVTFNVATINEVTAEDGFLNLPDDYPSNLDYPKHWPRLSLSYRNPHAYVLQEQFRRDISNMPNNALRGEQYESQIEFVKAWEEREFHEDPIALD